METHLIPVKTAEGHAELSSRQRRVSQRHRTMLLLVDGQRTVGEVLSLSSQAGVPETCLDELIALSLIVVPQSGIHRGPSARPQTPTATSAVGEDSAFDDLEEPYADFVDVDPAEDEALVPSASGGAAASDDVPSSSLPDTEFGMSTVVTDSVLDDADGGMSPDPLEEARELLVQAVSTEAPVAGALTLMRLKRARTPMELLALIHEVQTRVDRPHRAMATQHMMGRVAQLLSQAEAQAADY